MAQVSYRVDDLDVAKKVRKPAEVTGDSTTLTLNGRTVAIDLSDEHVKELSDLLAPYFDAGQEVTRKTTGSGHVTSPADAERNREVRAWWQAQNGREDLPPWKDRGRIPAVVSDAFDAATDDERDVDA